MRMQPRIGAKKCRLGILFWLCAAMAVADDIQTTTIGEQEEILPFVAVDASGRAVTDLQKAEIVLLVNGLNFRGFSLLSPGGSSFSGKPQAIPDVRFVITVDLLKFKPGDLARQLNALF